MSLRTPQVPLSVEKIVDDDSLAGLRLVHVDVQDTLKAVESLKSRADVLYAEPNYLRYRLATPNDHLMTLAPRSYTLTAHSLVSNLGAIAIKP